MHGPIKVCVTKPSYNLESPHLLSVDIVILLDIPNSHAVWQNNAQEYYCTETSVIRNLLSTPTTSNTQLYVHVHTNMVAQIDNDS